MCIIYFIFKDPGAIILQIREVDTQNCRYIKTDSRKGSWCTLPLEECWWSEEWFPSDQHKQTRPGMSGHCCWLSWWTILRPSQLRNNTKISSKFWELRIILNIQDVVIQVYSFHHYLFMVQRLFNMQIRTSLNIFHSRTTFVWE